MNRLPELFTITFLMQLVAPQNIMGGWSPLACMAAPTHSACLMPDPSPVLNRATLPPLGLYATMGQ